MEHEAHMGHEGSRLFAVIKTGGKQYCVAAGDTITVMTLAGNPGDRVLFDRVLMLSHDGEPALGTPFVDGASVGGQIVEHTRGPKAIAFKKRRRKNSKRKHGHRQDLTLVRITELLTGGADPSIETALRNKHAFNPWAQAKFAYDAERRPGTLFA
jgi:large subunit ribosomal protein L21